MAQQAPDGLDVTELKFKLQSKVPLFKGNGNAKDNCSLLAAASVHGLVFAGTIGPELRVLRLKDITIGERGVNDAVPLRTVPLPSEPFQLAVSCDHSFLAVDVVGNGGVPFIYIYSVPSFLTGSVVKLHEIRTSPQPGVRCTQICWNPVIHNMFSVRTEAGGLSVYTIKEQTGLEFFSLDAGSSGAQCACWSPKGKQLVVAFANGKLIQYKPDLKPARTIVCPPGVVEGGGGFDVLAIQWLSTYQFAAVFLPHAPDSVPALFIVNAPKVGNPALINYDDVCYSQSGPRKGQVFLLHILPWNLLLMASANSMEVGILGTAESGEAPTWCQWTTTDEARAELPLTVDKQESFPVGFALETGCTHELVINEQTFPVMPMIHLLSTYGQLVSFNVLNMLPNAPNICSPPKPVQDLTGGAFVAIDFEATTSQTPSTFQPASFAPNSVAPVNQQAPSDISFAVPSGATSTPAVPKTKSFFNAAIPPVEPAVQKSPVNLFASGAGGQQQKPPSATGPITPSFGKQITFGAQPPAAETKASPFVGFAGTGATGGFGSGGTTLGMSPGGLPTMSAPPFQSAMASMAPPASTPTVPGPDASKPLVTVPPTYVPPPTLSQQQPTGQSARTSRKSDLSSEDNNAIIRALTVDELKRFARELADMQQRNRTVSVHIGNKDESATLIRNLRELEDITAQANESTASLVSDVQALRLGLNEAFAMMAEANSKSAIYNNPSIHQYQEEHVMSQASRRQLAALESMLQVNENQLHTVTKQLGAQWMALEEAKRTDVRQRMHIPSLEVLYQTLSKQQEILNRQSEKLGYLKHKLGLKSTLKGLDDEGKRRHRDYQELHGDESAIESLTDSVLSMTLGEQVAADTKKLSEPKLAALRRTLVGRKVVTVKPKRPDRVGLSSEVVRERRDEARRFNLEQEKTQKAQAASQTALAAKKEAEQKKQQQQHQQQQLQHQQQAQKRTQQTAQQQPKPQQQTQQPAQQPLTKPLATSSSSANKPFAFPAQTTTGAAPPSFGSFSFGQTTITPMAAEGTVKTAGGNISTGLSFGAGANKENGEKKDIGVAGKENAAPAPLAKSSSSSLFSFGSALGSATGGTAFKPAAESTPLTGNGGAVAGKSVFSFAGAASSGGTLQPNNQQQQPAAPLSFGSLPKPTFSFDPSSSASAAVPFGNGSTLSFGAGANSNATDGPLNLGKPKQPTAANENVPPVGGDDSRKDKPLPPSFGPVDSNPTKAPLPALTSLLQRVDSTAAAALDSTVKVSSTMENTVTSSATAKPTAGGLFGSAGTGGAFQGSLFGSASSNGNTGTSGTSVAPAKSGGFLSGLSFGSTTITPVVTSPLASTAGSSSTSATAPTTTTTMTTSTTEGLLFGGVKATTTSASAIAPSSTSSGFTFGSNASFTTPALGTGTVTSTSGEPPAKPEPNRVEPASVSSAAISTVASSVTVSSSGGISFGSLPATVGKVIPSPVTAPTPATVPAKAVESVAPVAASTASPTTPSSTATVTDATSGLFSSISICSPNAATSPKTPPNTSGGNIFSSGAFGAAKPAGAETASIFGGGTSSSTTGGSLFGAAAKPAASVSSSFGAPAGTPVGASTGGLFGSIASPKTTVTAASTGSLFGSTASNASTTGIAGGGGSIFGGTSGGGFFGSAGATAVVAPAATAPGTGFGTAGSIFGGGSTTASATGGGNIFATPAPTGSGGGLFGSVTASNSNVTPGGGGSIFGGTSAFGAAPVPVGGGNIFGSPVAPTATVSSGTGLFGSVGTAAPFSSPQSPVLSQTTQSIFGGGASAGSPFASVDSSNNVNAFGSAAGGGTSAFSKPAAGFGASATFGGAPTFGGGPMFGGTPTFGGAPTFGSPKATFGGGGAFGGVTAAAPIGSPTQSNNLFEQLGSSSTSVSFGGLAQQQSAKPTQFGGSSFSSWR